MDETPTSLAWRADVLETLERIAFPERFDGDMLGASRCGSYSIEWKPHHGIMLSRGAVDAILAIAPTQQD